MCIHRQNVHIKFHSCITKIKGSIYTQMMMWKAKGKRLHRHNEEVPEASMEEATPFYQHSPVTAAHKHTDATKQRYSQHM